MAKTRIRYNEEHDVSLWVEDRSLGPVYSITSSRAMPAALMPSDAGDPAHNDAAFDRIVARMTANAQVK